MPPPPPPPPPPPSGADRDTYYFDHHHQNHHSNSNNNNHSSSNDHTIRSPKIHSPRPPGSPSPSRRTSSYRLFIPPPPPPPELSFSGDGDGEGIGEGGGNGGGGSGGGGGIGGGARATTRADDTAADADDEGSSSELDDGNNGLPPRHHHDDPDDADDELPPPMESNLLRTDDEGDGLSTIPPYLLTSTHSTATSHRRPRRQKKQYPAQDTRTTGVKELAGWYSYAWAAEAFAVCGVGSFVPLVLEGLARENGVVKGDVTGKRCSGSGVGGGSGAGEGGPGDPGGAVEQCVVYILGWGVNTASYAMYTFSISVFLQALVIISMSGAADHGKNRKRLLLFFAFMGSIATILFISVTSGMFILSALWAIIANVGFGASFVLLNAFLPVLVRNHPSLLSSNNVAPDPPIYTPPATPPPPTSNNLAEEHHPLLSSNPTSSPSGRLSYSAVDTGSAYLSSTFANTTGGSSASSISSGSHNRQFRHLSTPPSTTTASRKYSRRGGGGVAAAGAGEVYPNYPKKKSDPALVLSSQISSYGMAIGYTGAVLMQMFGIMLVIMTGSTVWSLQLVLACIGGWWFAFTVPAAIWLRPRPGPPLPGAGQAGKRVGVWDYVRYSWAGLWRTAKRARRLRDVMMFLAAWFMISDGVATVSGTAILFARTNLHMKPAEVALISVISTLFGVVGAFGWAKISQHFGISPSRTILIIILVFELIPIYGLLGFLPAIQRSGIVGLTQPSEMYLLGAIYGLVLGGIGSYCRSVFSELIPPGSEAAFFALYAITDKGSSVVGPLVVGVLTEVYGDIRAGFWFLAVLLLLPVPLVAWVDVRRGKREAGALAREEGRRWEEEVRRGGGGPPLLLDGGAEEEEEGWFDQA